MREEIKKRVADGKKDYPHRFSYVHGNAGEIHSVLCKLCRSVMRMQVEDPDYSESRKVNGRDVIVKRMYLRTLANYGEITIEFDDGSAHVTPLCKECCKSVQVSDLESIYCADMEQLLSEESSTAPMNWGVWSKRKPIGFKL